MFSSLRQDSLLYVLNRKENPTLSVGKVVSVSAPTPKYPNTYTTMMQGIETTIDITVNIDGSNVDFKKIPSNLIIYGDSGMVISETREAMMSEIETMKTNSRNVIESVDYHKRVLECCDTMLEQLNPSLAKEREQENKLNSLETRMGKIEDVLAEMNGTLKSIKGKE